MAHKLWEKNFEVNKEIERFTVGRDRELDLYLAPYDVLGSMAHITMLESIGLLEKDELKPLLAELRRIYDIAAAGQFTIDEGVEDVHSQVELMLTQRLGNMGKKIHSGRSRNDQVLVDLKLFTRHQLRNIVEAVKVLFDELQAKSEQYRHVLMPGYTHLQIAMPSSFGLWFGAHAESLADDMTFLLAAWRITNRNPLGSAAGYGSSFPLNRTLTTQLLGFAAWPTTPCMHRWGAARPNAMWPSPWHQWPPHCQSWPSTPVCSTARTSASCVCLKSVPRGRASCHIKRTPTCLS